MAWPESFLATERSHHDGAIPAFLMGAQRALLTTIWDQLSLSAVATETVSMSPWHEPLPDEWSAARSRYRSEARSAASRRCAGRVCGWPYSAARRTGLSHAQVNAELNLRWGLRRISEATVAQLETRLEQAERWLARA
jgi:hypothetical protein